MSDLSELIRKYTVNHSKKIKNICAPLVDQLGISTFSYYTIEQDGRYCIMSNFPEQLEFFFNEKLYLDCPYIAHPSLFRSGCALVPVSEDPYYLNKSRDDYGLGYLFLMIKRVGPKLEGYFFSKKNMDYSNANELFHQMDLFNKFGSYFKKEASSLIQKALHDGYNVHKAKKDAYLFRDNRLPLSNQNPVIQQFLKDTTLLSKQENECLELFKQGYSAQGTAAVMGLSPRTVESYFENIKNKLNCNSKWDLLSW